ncbi:hypothetical protein [Lacihabitans soyangensis]|uniref:Uncharacterized protein n=1 Tax=Lacihabitans soyangensis TaxID=869394 RepID=A0AAE3H643_9BACT|nr:hypothetical protein [Lacihabitans soyangensis]MCP9765583.1 hypothetical protein [Lacihabitans soyangensis]
MLKKNARLERFKKILVLSLLFVLGIGTLSGFATNYFSDSEDSNSPTYNQNKEEHHLDKFILAVAEVEEIEEETGDEKHDLSYLIPLAQQNFLNFVGRNEVRTVRISFSLSHRYTRKLSLVYLFRNIRI